MNVYENLYLSIEDSFLNTPRNLVQELCDCQHLEGGGTVKLLVAAMFFSEWGV